ADDTKAQEIFTAHEVTFDQDGDRVEVHARFKEDSGKWFRRGRVNFQVQYVIALPKRFNLELHTGAGSLTASEIEGQVKARTGGGDLKFATIKGPFEGNTSSGSVTLQDVDGLVTASTSGGDIRIGQLEDVATAETGSGSIAVKAAKARLSVKTNGG